MDEQYQAAQPEQPAQTAQTMPPYTPPAYAAPQGNPYAASGASSAPAAAQQKPKRTGYIVAIVILAVLLVISIGVASCSMVVAGTSAISSIFSYDDDTYTYNDTVAVIEIDDTIDHDNGDCGPEGLAELLAEVEDDDNIKAVVLHVNSGGGTSSAGEEMAALVAACTKPVIVSSASTNASAAYEISSQADYIFVNNSTLIGSIGTAIQFTDLSELYELLGINYQNVVSSEGKDSSYGTRALTDEEWEYYQDIVDEINENFIETVAAGRGMTVEEVRELATGQIFSGQGAVENGLADEIGTFQDALEYAAYLGGITGDYDVEYLSSDSSSIDLSSLLSDTDLSAEELVKILAILDDETVVAYSSID